MPGNTFGAWAALADGSVWIRVAEGRTSADGGLWLWHPRLITTPGDSATLARIQREGWQPVPVAQYPALLEVLQGQLAPVLAVRAAGQDQPVMWARPEDIERAIATPVVLAFSVPVDPEHPDLYSDGQVHIVQSVPPPWLGIYGLAVINATAENWSSTVYDFQGTGDSAMIALRGRLRDALFTLASPVGWPEQTPFLDLCAQTGGYEHLSQEVRAGLLAAHTDEERAMLHETQAGLDNLLAQANALKEQRARILNDPRWWGQEWGKLHEMATQLTAAYWQAHQAATQPRTLPTVAHVFDSVGQTQIPSAMPILTITQAQANGKTGTGWANVGGYPTSQHRTEHHDTAIQMRPEDRDTVLDETTIAGLWAQVHAMSDLDADVFLAMIAQWMHAAQDKDGYVWITAEHILEYRGVQPMMKREGQRERRAGHRQEDMIEVARCIGRQERQWVVVRSLVVDESRKGKGGKESKALYTREARLTTIAEVIQRHELLPADERTAVPSYSVAWRYQPGKWLETFIEGPNRHMAWLCQQTLRYDRYHEQWEKRLARYFMFHLRINAAGGGGSIVRGVGNLIRELGLSIDERNPDRTCDRFEKAMNRLADDGQIESWGYTDATALPARKWLETWLGQSIRITAAPLTQERYASIPQHARQRQERAGTLRALREAKGTGKSARKGGK